jgi:hypothetical protein
MDPMSFVAAFALNREPNTDESKPAPIAKAPSIYEITVPMPCQKRHLDDAEVVALKTRAERAEAEVTVLKARLAAKPKVVSVPAAKAAPASVQAQGLRVERRPIAVPEQPRPVYYYDQAPTVMAPPSYGCANGNCPRR